MKFRVACICGAQPAVDFLKERLHDAYEIVHAHVISNDASALQAELIEICDRGSADCIITTGGTGLSLQDRAPQATAAIVDFEVPGIGEAIRAAAAHHDRSAMFSRVYAGVRHKTLILNLPGNPKALSQALDMVASSLPSALLTLTERS